MLINVEKLGEFCFHIGGIGDVFYTLSSCYDEKESLTFLSYANNPAVIKELLGTFLKINRKLVLLNKGNYPDMAQTMSRAKFTGHLPPQLNYMNWAQYNIFKDFKLTQTSWLEEISKKRIRDFQVCLQPGGSGQGGHSNKKVCIKPEYWEFIIRTLRDNKIVPCVLGLPSDLDNYPTATNENYTHLSLQEQMQLIRASDLVIGADTWGKNLSLFAKIPTIVWKNYYINEMQGFNEDPADPIFLYQWEEQGNLMLVEQDDNNALSNFKNYLHSVINEKK